MLNRLAFGLLCLLGALLAAVLCVGVALAADVPPPAAMDAPALVIARAGESIWWIEGADTGLDDPCLDVTIFNAFRVDPATGTHYGYCVPGNGTAARWTLMADGPCRVVTWRGEVIERRRCVYLPTLGGAP